MANNNTPDVPIMPTDGYRRLLPMDLYQHQDASVPGDNLQMTDSEEKVSLAEIEELVQSARISATGEVVAILRRRNAAKLGAQALHYLLLAGDFSAAAFMFDCGMNSNVAFGDVTLLSMAAAMGDVRTVRFLLDHDADPLRRSERSGWTPIDFAINGGHIVVVDMLVACATKRQY